MFNNKFFSDVDKLHFYREDECPGEEARDGNQ